MNKKTKTASHCEESYAVEKFEIHDSEILPYDMENSNSGNSEDNTEKKGLKRKNPQEEMISKRPCKTLIKNSSAEQFYMVKLSEVPKNLDIKHVLGSECGPLDDIEILKNDQGQYRLIFQNEDYCKNAIKQFKAEGIQVKKLNVKLPGRQDPENDDATDTEATEVIPPSKLQEDDKVLQEMQAFCFN